MNKWRRLQKQSMRRRMKRILAIKASLRRAMMRGVGAAGLAQLNAIRATPASRFMGGELGKALAIAKAFEGSLKALEAARASIR